MIWWLCKIAMKRTLSQQKCIIIYTKCISSKVSRLSMFQHCLLMIYLKCISLMIEFLHISHSKVRKKNSSILKRVRKFCLTRVRRMGVFHVRFFPTLEKNSDCTSEVSLSHTNPVRIIDHIQKELSLVFYLNLMIRNNPLIQ